MSTLVATSMMLGRLVYILKLTTLKVDVSIWLFILIKHLYLSDMWVGVVQEHIHEGQVFKKIGPRVQKMIAILGSIVKIIGEGDLKFSLSK